MCVRLQVYVRFLGVAVGISVYRGRPRTTSAARAVCEHELNKKRRRTGDPVVGRGSLCARWLCLA